MLKKKLADPTIVTKFINVTWNNGQTTTIPCHNWTADQVENTRAQYERFTDCDTAYIS